jgi:hypothetical protein
LIAASASVVADDDSVSSAAVVDVSASASITEAADSISATLVALVSAAASVAEQNDSESAEAIVLVTATSDINEDADEISATVSGSTEITLTGEITEADDALSAAVAVSGGASQAFRGGGYSRPYPYYQRPKLQTVVAALSLQEQNDSCSATVKLGHSPVDIDNNFLLMAA